jgi:hypothetical protein
MKGGFGEGSDGSDVPDGHGEAFKKCVIRGDMKITHASSLTNSQLVAEVSRLAGGEREATVALLVHLAEFDARRLHEGAGFQSLFDYCMRVLHFSEDAATGSPPRVWPGGIPSSSTCSSTVA